MHCLLFGLQKIQCWMHSKFACLLILGKLVYNSVKAFQVFLVQNFWFSMFIILLCLSNYVVCNNTNGKYNLEPSANVHRRTYWEWFVWTLHSFRIDKPKIQIGLWFKVMRDDEESIEDECDLALDNMKTLKELIQGNQWEIGNLEVLSLSFRNDVNAVWVIYFIWKIRSFFWGGGGRSGIWFHTTNTIKVND